MSRVIKFRAWDVKEGKYFDCNRLNFEFDSVNEIFERDYLIFEQFTGFKDSEGKEIYEGDILKNKYNKERTTISFTPCELQLLQQLSTEFRIIGNIHLKGR